MVEIIEENRKPSFGQKLSGAIGTGLSQGAQLYDTKKENEALKKQGIDLAGIKDPEMRKVIAQAAFKQKESKKELGNTFNTILDDMESFKEYVGPANIASLNPWSETSGKRSQINTLRLSLEGLFRDLTLKGQFPKAIYERILKELPSSSDTEKQYMNHIEGIRKIIKAHYGNELTAGAPSNSEVKFVKIKNKKTGQIYNIPESEAENAISAGGERV